MDIQAFSPTGDNAVVAATAASGSVTLPGNTGNQIRVYNAAAAAAFFRVSIGASTAVTTDSFVAPGGTETFSIPPRVDTFSVILASGTGNVYAQRGFGL